MEGLITTSEWTIQLRRAVTWYTLGNILPSSEVLDLDATKKLILLQRTPEKAVKERTIWNTTVKYVEVWYVERALNFVSNFQRWQEVVDKGFVEYMADSKKWPRKVYEARVQADFYIILWDRKIERTCFGSWQSFDNPAVSKYSIYSSALSIATKAFGDTLGIGSDKKDIENASLQKAKDQLEIPTIQEVSEKFTSPTNNA